MSIYPADGATYYNTTTGEVISGRYEEVDKILEKVPEGASILWGEILDGRHYYVSNGVSALRPVADDISVNSEGEVDFGSNPSGSTGRVANEDGDSVVFTLGSEPLILDDPGKYFVLVSPPFPTKEKSFTLVIE